MNIRMIGKYLGYLLWAEAAFMLPSVAVGLVYWERSAAFLLLASGLCGLLGLVLYALSRRESGSIYAKEGFVVAGGGWLLISLMGALPYWLSGEIPHFIDALFESASGFTTTGASILHNVEAMSRCLLFWRSFTNWLGGIGVLVFILAVVRARQGKGFTLHLLRAESPGPQVGKLRAKTQDSVRILFGIYILLTAIYFLFLILGGMPVFDALCAMFSTAGTGGFGIKNTSFADYSLYIQIVTGVFMALFSLNFSLYYLLLRRDWRPVIKDEELRLFLIIFAGAVVAIALSLYWFGGMAPGQSLHESGFAVSTILSTTGYSVSDFDLWPQFSRSLLVVLMLFGGMAGSTAGGFKISRVLILLKSMKAGLHRMLHPRSIKAVKINGKTIGDDVIHGTQLFLSVYVGICIVSLLVVSADGFTFETNLSAVLSAVNNIGPGLGVVSPAGNFAGFSILSKLVFIFDMLLGRLEIFPILLLLFPTTWKRKG